MRSKSAKSLLSGNSHVITENIPEPKRTHIARAGMDTQTETSRAIFVVLGRCISDNLTLLTAHELVCGFILVGEQWYLEWIRALHFYRLYGNITPSRIPPIHLPAYHSRQRTATSNKLIRFNCICWKMNFFVKL